MVYRLLIYLQYYAMLLIVTHITRYLDLKTVRLSLVLFAHLVCWS